MACCQVFRQKQKLLLLTQVRNQGHISDLSIKGSGDSPDVIPKVLKVSIFDLSCDLFCFACYFFDIASDVWIAWFHYRMKHATAFVLLLVFTVVPLIVLNCIGFAWSYHDFVTDQNKPLLWRKLTKRGLVFRAIASILLVGPSLWYLEAFTYGLKFRKRHKHDKVTNANDIENETDNSLPSVELYLRILEADRDVTLLRLFEAFMEAAPQALIQGYYFASAIWRQSKGEVTLSLTYVVVQSVSTCFSVGSLSWALIAQHRCLRFARQDKLNISWPSCIVQWIWRFLTIASRIMILIAFALAFHFWVLVLCLLHLAIMTVWILVFQPIALEAGCCAEVLIIFAASFVHLFTPLNLTEGKTLPRYVWCYSIELTEFVVLALLCVFRIDFDFPKKRIVLATGLGLFFAGIGFMLIFYKWFHPEKRTLKRNPPEVKQNGIKSNIAVDESNVELKPMEI